MLVKFFGIQESQITTIKIVDQTTRDVYPSCINPQEYDMQNMVCAELEAQYALHVDDWGLALTYLNE